MQPTVVRSNHRFRGPAESTKMSNFRDAVHSDLLRSYITVEEFKAMVEAERQSLFEGKELDEPAVILTQDENGSTVRTEITHIEGRWDFTRRLQAIADQIAAKGGEIHG